MKKKVKILSKKLVVVINVVFKPLFKRWFLVRSPLEGFGQETQREEGLAVIGDVYFSIQQPAVFQTTTVCFQGNHPASDRSIPPI